MEFKEIIKKIRKEVKEAYPGIRTSVRENHGGYSYSITIAIENPYDFDKAVEIVSKYQDSRDSDIMTDYFNYNFYCNYSRYFN